MMHKKTSIAILVLVLLASSPCAGKGPEGYWYGYVRDGSAKNRIAMVFDKDVAGDIKANFSIPEYGIHYQLIEKVTVSGKDLHAKWSGVKLDRTESDPITWDLRLNWWGNRLSGTSTASGKEYSVELRRGVAFMMPRIKWDGKVQTGYSYHKPRRSSDGWKVGDLRDGQTDVKLIESGIHAILDQQYTDVHGLVVIKDGKLVLEEYFYGFGPDEAHLLCSVTKSVFSTLFGIAFDQGLMSPEEKLYDHFPEYRSKPGWSPRKEKTTLGDLLAMSSGTDCDDLMEHAPCINRMWMASDWLDFCFSIPATRDPGREFIYCNPCLEPLGVLLQRKNGLTVPEFAQKYLYDPLGIQADRWMTGPNGITEICTGHWLRPRDMAKLGELYLRKGRWDGKQVISEKWIEKATTAKTTVALPYTLGKWEYGYSWWLRPVLLHGRKYDAFTAQGAGGQYIWVVPEMNLVGVITSGSYDDGGAEIIRIGFFEKYIVNAFQDGTK